MWLENEDCHTTVKEVWRTIPSASPMAQAMGKIENCQVQLRRWSKHSVCNIIRTLVEKKKSLHKAEAAAVQGGSVDFFLQLKNEVNDLL